jgi:hypothetical protein
VSRATRATRHGCRSTITSSSSTVRSAADTASRRERTAHRTSDTASDATGTGSRGDIRTDGPGNGLRSGRNGLIRQSVDQQRRNRNDARAEERGSRVIRDVPDLNHGGISRADLNVPIRASTSTTSHTTRTGVEQSVSASATGCASRPSTTGTTGYRCRRTDPTDDGGMRSATGTTAKCSCPAIRRSARTIRRTTDTASCSKCTTDCGSRSTDRRRTGASRCRDIRADRASASNLCGRSNRLIRATIGKEGRDRDGTSSEERSCRVVGRVSDLDSRGVGRTDLNYAIGTGTTTTSGPSVTCVHDGVSTVASRGTSRTETTDTASERGSCAIRTGNRRVRGTTSTTRERGGPTGRSEIGTIRGTTSATSHRESATERTSNRSRSRRTSTSRDRNRDTDRASTSRLSRRSQITFEDIPPGAVPGEQFAVHECLPGIGLRRIVVGARGRAPVGITVQNGGGSREVRRSRDVSFVVHRTSEPELRSGHAVRVADVRDVGVGETLQCSMPSESGCRHWVLPGWLPTRHNVAEVGPCSTPLCGNVSLMSKSWTVNYSREETPDVNPESGSPAKSDREPTWFA